MNKQQLDILEKYIKYGKAVILCNEIPEEFIKKEAIVLEADCTNTELNGDYKELEYIKPEWYAKLMEKSKKHVPVLIINQINKISENEQRKFIEIFKYKKAYINKLPENCVIFATYLDLDKNPIEQEVYSFMAQI